MCGSDGEGVCVNLSCQICKEYDNDAAGVIRESCRHTGEFVFVVVE